MIVQMAKAKKIDFEGLGILDYTDGLGLNSSMAKIVVPAGVRHRTAYSKRSDKFYYVMTGQVDFMVEGDKQQARAGDVCVIRKEQKFSYVNEGKTEAELILVHTPAFNLEAEVFV